MISLFSHKGTKTQRRQIFLLFVASCLCVNLFFLPGCKKEEPKVFPQDQLSIEYTVNNETIMIGDPVELVVTAYFPTNGTLGLPEIGREKDVVLLKRDWANIPREDGLTQSESRYRLTSFRLGEHLVSTGQITCVVGGETLTADFPPVTLSVISSLPEEASLEISDIKPVHKLTPRIPDWVWISLLAVSGAFLAGFIASKLWRNREKLIPTPPPRPPHLAAFEALEALRNKGLLEQGECNPFYTELSLILRTYLEGRFRLNAPDETTEEIVIELSKSPELNGAQRNILQDFMRQADMVKFAKGHPDRQTMEAAFDTTKQFVSETKYAGDAVPQIGNRKSEIYN